MKQPVPCGRGIVKRALYCASRLPGLIAFLILLADSAVANDLQGGFDAYLRGDYAAAFAVLSPAATIDNPQIQNLIALMIYDGRGVSANPAAAHDLFESAASLGVVDARRNLDILHSIGALGVEVDYEEARLWFTTTVDGDYADEDEGDSLIIPAGIASVIEVEFKYDGDGKRTYLMFCAGCHGFSGMHSYPFAPSFAMGERMIKSSEELLQSILNGKGLMPSWECKLPLSELEGALGYLRELALRTAYGTDTSAYDSSPDMFFIFSPTGIEGTQMRDWGSDPLDSE